MSRISIPRKSEIMQKIIITKYIKNNKSIIHKMIRGNKCIDIVKHLARFPKFEKT